MRRDPTFHRSPETEGAGPNPTRQPALPSGPSPCLSLCPNAVSPHLLPPIQAQPRGALTPAASTLPPSHPHQPRPSACVSPTTATQAPAGGTASHPWCVAWSAREPQPAPGGLCRAHVRGLADLSTAPAVPLCSGGNTGTSPCIPQVCDGVCTPGSAARATDNGHKPPSLPRGSGIQPGLDSQLRWGGGRVAGEQVWGRRGEEEMSLGAVGPREERSLKEGQGPRPHRGDTVEERGREGGSLPKALRDLLFPLEAPAKGQGWWVCV